MFQGQQRDLVKWSSSGLLRKILFVSGHQGSSSSCSTPTHPRACKQAEMFNNVIMTNNSLTDRTCSDLTCNILFMNVYMGVIQSNATGTITKMNHSPHCLIQCRCGGEMLNDKIHVHVCMYDLALASNWSGSPLRSLRKNHNQRRSGPWWMPRTMGAEGLVESDVWRSV